MEESEKKEEKSKNEQDIKNEKKVNNDYSKLIRNSIIATCTAMLIFFPWDIMYKIVNYSSFYIFEFSIPLTMIFGVIMFTLLFAISKKTSRATYISCGIIFVLSIINQLKLSFSGEPLCVSDINFLLKIPSLLGLISGNVSFNYVLEFIVIFAIFAFVLFLISILNKKFNITLENKKARILIIIVDLILIAFFIFPTKTTQSFILKNFYKIDSYKDYATYTNNYEYYFINGIINGIYGDYLNSFLFEPEGYDEDELDAILEDISSESDDSLGTPNIIMVFSESFWNIDELDEIEFNQEVVSNYNKLKEYGYVVNSISPTYGGMTENVVFEMLTGCSMKNFSSGYIPIMSLYSKKSDTKVTSLINLYKDNGYYSKILFGKDYYNSENAYITIGFDEYEEIYDGTVEVPTDESLIDTAISDINNLQNQGNYFYVIESFEAHMPYSDDKYDEYEIEIIKSDLSEEANTATRSYAEAIHNADTQLERLYEYVQTLDEPTLLIYLGDHLPYILTSNGEDSFAELEYFNTDDELLNYYRKYNTEILILSNYDVDFSDYPDYLGTDTILTYLTEHMDIETSSYYDWLYSTIDILPASNRYISLDSEGNVYSTNDLTGEMKEVSNLRNLMQYKFFIF